MSILQTSLKIEMEKEMHQPKIAKSSTKKDLDNVGVNLVHIKIDFLMKSGVNVDGSFYSQGMDKAFEELNKLKNLMQSGLKYYVKDFGDQFFLIDFTEVACMKVEIAPYSQERARDV